MELKTTRLLLRPTREDDLASSRAIWMDPQVRRYIGAAPTDDEFRAAFFEDLSRSAGDYGFKSVIEIESGLHVGDAGLVQKHVERRPEVEVLYFFGLPFWGRGFASEAAGALVEHGFAALGLRRIVALIHPDNQASMRVAQRVGMAFEREVVTDSGKTRRMYVVAR